MSIHHTLDHMRIILLLIFICSHFLGTELHAEDQSTEELETAKTTTQSPHKFKGILAFMTDYVSRGVSESFRLPAIQGEFDYEHISGIYFKMWGSNVDARIINRANLELDLYLGFKHSLLNTQAKYDIGLLYYYYPGGASLVPANTSYNTLEYYVAYDYKKLEIKLSLTVTDFFGNNSSNPPMNWNNKKPVRPNGHSYGSPYLEINYEFPLYTKWKGALHLGYQGVINYPELNYVDWQIGVIRTFAWFDASLAYVQSTADKAFYALPNNLLHPNKRTYLGGASAIFSVAKSF